MSDAFTLPYKYREIVYKLAEERAEKINEYMNQK